MENADLPGRLSQVPFHGPLSQARAARLTERLTRNHPGTVLDIGCGWGELMLRILAAVPDATGVGTTRGPADLVLCVGASHSLSDVQPPGQTAAALTALRRLVTPGGRVLLGEGFWQRPPTAAELAAMWPGTTAGELLDLAQIADLAVAAGFRPAWIETATEAEWEEFESGYQADEEEWLAAHPDHPEAAEIRQRLDEHRSYWLRGYRGLLGLAYLTLIPVG